MCLKDVNEPSKEKSQSFTSFVYFRIGELKLSALCDVTGALAPH